jgi:hypothetical protein
MDEYAALAQRVVLTMDDVRGCLVLSRDGMILGAYPEEDEQSFKPAWLTFAHVGEARRGFVEFSDQMWAYVHRGPYAAFVIAGTGVRPGVLLDQLEQAVLAAEESRAKKGETLKVPDASSAPSGRPRTSLHPAEPRTTPEPAPEPVASAPPPEQRAWNGRRPNMAQPPEPAGQERVAAGGAEPSFEPEPVVDRLRPATFEPELVEPPSPEIEIAPAGRPSPEIEVTPAGRPSPEIEVTPAGRPSPEIEVTPAGRPAAFATDGSPFARLEAEQAAATAERPTPAEAIPGFEPLAATPLTEPHPEPAPPAVAQPADAEPAASFRREPQRLVSSEPASEEDAGTDEPGEVDRVMLAKEFSGLLQLNEDGDEDNS